MSGASHAFATEARVRPRAVRERGFGLVEPMVSMLIGLVIIGALVTLFVNTSGGNRELVVAMNEKLNRLIDAEVGEDRGQMLPGGAEAGWEVTATTMAP